MSHTVNKNGVSSFSVVHEDINFIGCSDTEKEYIYALDGEEMEHADFNRKKGVMTLPEFADPFSYGDNFQLALSQIEACKQNLAVDIKAYKSPAEKMGKTLIH